MFNQRSDVKILEKVTGFILPVGNGAVGKSTLSLVMDSNGGDFPETRKSINIEFGYVRDYLEVDQTGYQIMQQFLVPPGQKESEGIDSSRSFERMINTYEFLFRRIDVILLTYKMDELESFNDLEYWIFQSLPMSNKQTHFMLVGTHLDKETTRQVSENMIVNGIEFIEKKIKSQITDWTGRCSAYEVSARTGQNLNILRHAISMAILESRKVV